MKMLKSVALFVVVGVLCAGLILAVPAKKDDAKKKVFKTGKGDAIVVNVDLSGLEKSLEALGNIDVDIKGLEALENLKIDLKGLEGLKALDNIDVDIKGLDALKNLKIDLKGLEGLKALENLDIDIKGLEVLDNLDKIIENSLQGLKHLEALEDLEINVNVHGWDKKKSAKKEKKNKKI